MSLRWRQILGFTLLVIIIIGALFVWNDQAIAPDDPASPTTYTCPDTEYVNCMPIVEESKQWMCEPDYLQWAQENCPGFQGAAY